MRLTLRTMLAYLDDILEPDDTEDIGKKIEESEFATNLVHRTRDCMRRLRLGVPALIGRGLATDPNSVAEYLDNTLAPDRVGEFEKVCLESDVHLAEVASCHQILTLVLGEPAEIDPEARRKVYALAAQVDAPPVQEDALQTASASGSYAAPQRTQRVKPEVPDYLRESRSPNWAVAATVLVATLLTFAGLAFFGPANLRGRLASLVTGENSAAEDVSDADASPNAPDTTAPADNQPATGEQTPPAEAKAEQPASDQSAPDNQAISVESSEPEAPDDDVPPPKVNKTDEPSVPATASSLPAGEPLMPEAAGGKPGAGIATPLPDKPADAASAVNEPLPGATSPPVSPPSDDQPAKPTDDAAAPRTDAAPETFGRYTSKRGDILLKFDADKNSWIRLAPMLPLLKGERLLSLPLFRPTIALGTSITLQTEGAASLELVGWTDQGVPIVGVEYGRLLMRTIGKPGNPLQLKMGENLVQLTFTDADAELAVDIRRALPPGSDPSVRAPLVAEIYATSGLIHVREGEKEFDMQAPAVRTLLSTGGQPPADNDFPKWVTSEAPTDSEGRATRDLEPLLAAGEPAALTLKELADAEHPVGRKREVRSLAVRSLRHLDDFEACVAALNDPKERLSWPVYMEELRTAVAQSPEMAEQVNATFVKQRGADAAFLYRMLWGYSAADLKNGADQDLVDGLGNDSLDFRVMSLWNLQNITGAGNLGFRPEEFAGKRRVPFNAWKERLRQHKIVPHASSSSPRGKSTTKGG